MMMKGLRETLDESAGWQPRTFHEMMWLLRDMT